MEYEKHGTCDDCNIQGELTMEDACADSSVGYGLCCYKYVCKNGCYWKCSFCFRNTDSDNIMYVSFLKYKFDKLFQKQLDEYRSFLLYELPFEQKINANIINILNLTPTIYVEDNQIKGCQRHKIIESTLCNHCINIYAKSNALRGPLLWWGISNDEWLQRYD